MVLKVWTWNPSVSNGWWIPANAQRLGLMSELAPFRVMFSKAPSFMMFRNPSLAKWQQGNLEVGVTWNDSHPCGPPKHEQVIQPKETWRNSSVYDCKGHNGGWSRSPFIYIYLYIRRRVIVCIYTLHNTYTVEWIVYSNIMYIYIFMYNVKQDKIRWTDIICHNTIWYSMIWYHTRSTQYDLIRFNMIWYDMIWFDIQWNTVISDNMYIYRYIYLYTYINVYFYKYINGCNSFGEPFWTHPSFPVQRKLMQNFGYSVAASKEDAMMVDAYCFVFSGKKRTRQGTQTF